MKISFFNKIYLFFFFAFACHLQIQGTSSCWTRCDGCRLSCTMASTKQDYKRHWKRNLLHFRIHQSLLIFRNNIIRLWIDVSSVGGL